MGTLICRYWVTVLRLWGKWAPISYACWHFSPSKAVKVIVVKMNISDMSGSHELESCLVSCSDLCMYDTKITPLIRHYMIPVPLIGNIGPSVSRYIYKLWYDTIIFRFCEHVSTQLQPQAPITTVATKVGGDPIDPFNKGFLYFVYSSAGSLSVNPNLSSVSSLR